MGEVEYVQLQRRYGGLYIARRNGDVIATASTYDELADRLEQSSVPWAELVIEFVERVDAVGVH